MSRPRAFDALKPSQPVINGEKGMPASRPLPGAERSYLSRTWPWLLRLALLTAVVFAVHLALLNSTSLSLNLRPSTHSAAFTTRTITPVALTPAATARPSGPTQVNEPAPTKTKPRPSKPPATSPPSTLASSETAITPAPLAEPAPEPIKEAEVAPATPSESPVPPSTAAQTGEASTDISGEPAAAFAAPLAAKYVYNVLFTKNANSNKGTAELNWQHDGANYALSLTASYFAIPVFIQNSVGQLTSQGLSPTRFSDKRFRKSEVAAHFNQALGKITFSANTPDALLLAGTQDRVSVILQLSGQLAADPAKYPPGATLNLQTVSATEAEPWLFTVNEPETLNLPAGPQIALRITRNPRREFDQKVELWFAPGFNYAPVRFRFTETNGDYVDAQLQSTQYLSPLKPN